MTWEEYCGENGYTLLDDRIHGTCGAYVTAGKGDVEYIINEAKKAGVEGEPQIYKCDGFKYKNDDEIYQQGTFYWYGTFLEKHEPGLLD